MIGVAFILICLGTIITEYWFRVQVKKIKKSISDDIFDLLKKQEKIPYYDKVPKWWSDKIIKICKDKGII